MPTFDALVRFLREYDKLTEGTTSSTNN